MAKLRQLALWTPARQNGRVLHPGMPWLQELLQKDFLFLNPAAKTVSAKEITELYHGIFGLSGTKK